MRCAELETFSDSRYGVSFNLPKGWTATPQELADGRKLVVASDPQDESANVFVAFTPIRPDYSSLGSFGTIDYMAATIIPQCGAYGECRFANGDAIEGRMLESAAKGSTYVRHVTARPWPRWLLLLLLPGVRVSSGARARLCPGRQVYDYTIEQSRGPKRHLRSLFAIKSDGAASILIGLTTQCLESRYAELGPTYKAIISSFKS